MRLLAIDTSSLACSVAVQADDRVSEQHEVKPREHTRILLPMIRAALDEAQIAMADLDAVALGNGPGSFIGMRIGASVAQGLAFAAGIGILPVSSMAAVARQAGGPGETVVVAQDAHMGQVYLGRYTLDDTGLPVATEPECLYAPGAESTLVSKPAIAAGAGFERYPELLGDAPGMLSFKPDCLYPRAADVLALAMVEAAAGGAIAADALEPAYLREEVAKTSAERASGART